MAGYMEYKDSGVSWIGEIPAHWETRRIKSLATEKNAAFLDGDWINEPDISEEGIRYLTTGNIGQGFFKEQGKGYISEETFQRLNCLEVHGGDLVISRLNEPVGRACIIPEKYDRCIVAVDNVVLRPDTTYDKKFLMYAMSSEQYAEYALLLARGTTMQRISRTMLGTMFLPIPSLNEQKCIAEYLDAKTERIDAIINEAKASIEEYKAWKSSIIYEAVTKGLELGVKMKDSCTVWMGPVPSHWKLERAKWHFTFRNERGNDTPVLLAATQKHGMYPQDMIEGVVKVAEGTDVQQFKTVHKGDFVISLRSFQGGFERSDYEGVCSPAYQVFYADDFWSNDYLKYLFKNELFIDAMNALTVGIREGRNIKYEDFANSVLAIPPLAEQIEIAQYLEIRCKEIDDIVAEKQALITDLETYKKSLIFEVVTGKRKVV